MSSRRRLTIKHHEAEIRLFTRRVIVCVFFIFLFAGALIGRLAYLQVFEHDFYSNLSEQNFMTIIPTEPNRGLIYDRNGVLLAKNVPSFNLMINPSKVTNLAATIDRLKRFIDITPHDLELFKRRLKQTSPHQPVPLKMKLDEAETTRFYENQYFFPGVTIETRMIRTYPKGELFSHVLGYVGRINEQEQETIDKINYSASDYIGKIGIEKEYENILHGTVGNQEVETDANGRILRILKENKPIPGQDLYLSIDSRLQQVASDALGSETGSIIVINPNNGEILAMVSKPFYNPDAFVMGITTQDYQQLLNAPDKPLYDRSVRGVFPPGSTIKPFYAIGALDSKAITMDYKIHDTGIFMLPGVAHVYHDHSWKSGGQGIVDVVKGLIISNDTFFWNVAVRLGIRAQDRILFNFGFGKPTGIDLPNELSGLVPTPEWKRKIHGESWYMGDSVAMGIGQGYLLVTPLQLVQGIALIAGRGSLYQPHLLMKSVQGGRTVFQPQYRPRQIVTLQDPKIWDTVISAMQKVVMKPGGTAYGFFNGATVTYQVAGKTGTAQVTDIGGEDKQDANTPRALRNNHLFIAFAPIDHPQIAIAVMYEHGLGAPRMARQVMDAYFNVPTPPTQPTPLKPGTPSSGQPNNNH
ncbi:MAG: penicillin-binding protein 2 [Proteobacteria bacterium]|nr:penicillin-binding protein 2 [Pseudomonadota bacterium]